MKGKAMKEMIKPGGEMPIHCESNDGTFEIGFSFENFPLFDMIKISNDGSSYVLPARVYDANNRLLILNTVITCKCGTMQVVIICVLLITEKTKL